MSTIASPREPQGPLVRRTPSQQQGPFATPTSSARPSLDTTRSRSPMGSPNPNSGSPNPNAHPHPNTTAATTTRRNRAALREYYNIKKPSTATPPPQVEVTDPFGETGGIHEQYSEVPPSEMDKEDFDADAFVKKALAENSMEELLRLYTRVLGETRALDAEKKALVYDNFSKLIAATETIRKMRTGMDPLNPMASTLDPAIAQVYSQASAIRDSVRKSIPDPSTTRDQTADARQVRARTRQLAIAALDAPDKVRALVADGHLEDAREAWKTPRKLLTIWKEKGQGGIDVDACIEDGDAALRGEPSKGNWRETAGKKD
ncbi:Vps51/Vps67-domain-containing protein [Durotheca rogersii]|uniref:Vps51/Vps67-domain-containing protein n=1 Tax=Durotheca rogersii TaxID=419775 RepID=UPI0022206DB9|nr:Vps51/Vps67-domain-containing protein [Durotheca rogersii]KAI5863816.1 Vps51/Vps67-domain-containing protein [Durotheca rogersii]